MSKFLKYAALLVGCTALATPALADEGPAKGDTSGKVIALANNYAGNSWRQAMLRDWEKVVAEAKEKGLVKDAPSYTTAENSVTDQAQQIQNLILQGVDAIVLDAASPTALNGSVKQACDSGIVVVSFDQIVTEDCAYRIATDNKSMGVTEVNYLADRLGGKGTLLEVRGLAGGAIDADIHAGVVETMQKYPGLKIAGEARGDWTQTVAQKEVSGILPTLPEIDGVITQGGDGFGTAQAFLNAGRKLPIIIMGNRYDEVTFWQQQRDKDGFETMSISSAPGMVQMGFWVAQQVLAGKEVPKQITIPLLELHQKDLDYWVKHTPEGGVTTASYPLDWTVQAIDALQAGKPLPEVPLVE
ncbi:Simple sugar transport system substrate-binding protein [uncultured Pleomorphomonas sp.]|uniref:Simple sugar transport system substrate-binding protein n=1 Tax=uncultured Pleomorphomonas sp. TaxID=442121 RepID=A0A212LG11_9HYPH|nr:ABC transporter substrate-binding protein [uncultured Pleomorphomonas sp.]SCM76506.1 Simple sugar transport system substrate-binding protein [uncultured Pleomorphomonas sp.]